MVFIDFFILLIEMLASFNLFFDIPELRETVMIDGNYIGEDGEVISYFMTTEFAFYVSVITSIITIG